MTTTKSKAAPTADLLADRPRWQREELLPDLPTIDWPWLRESPERHVAAVAELRAALEVGDQAAEETALATLGDIVLADFPRLWQHFPTEGEAAFREAAAKVTPTAAAPDGSRPIDPVPASVEGSGDLIDRANEKAAAFDRAYRAEVAKLADSRRDFAAETTSWRAFFLRFYLRGFGAVCADVLAVEKHREAA